MKPRKYRFRRHARNRAWGGRAHAVDSVMGDSMGRLWRALVHVHREIENTPWGSVLLGNVWPAYLFALPLAARLWSLFQTVRQLREPSLHDQARVLQEAVTVVFLALVVILFAVRRRGIQGQRATWREGVVALLGTFLLNAEIGRAH